MASSSTSSAAARLRRYPDIPTERVLGKIDLGSLNVRKILELVIFELGIPHADLPADVQQAITKAAEDNHERMLESVKVAKKPSASGARVMQTSSMSNGGRSLTGARHDFGLDMAHKFIYSSDGKVINLVDKPGVDEERHQKRYLQQHDVDDGDSDVMEIDVKPEIPEDMIIMKELEMPLEITLIEQFPGLYGGWTNRAFQKPKEFMDIQKSLMIMINRVLTIYPPPGGQLRLRIPCTMCDRDLASKIDWRQSMGGKIVFLNPPAASENGMIPGLTPISPMPQIDIPYPEQQQNLADLHAAGFNSTEKHKHWLSALEKLISSQQVQTFQCEVEICLRMKEQVAVKAKGLKRKHTETEKKGKAEATAKKPRMLSTPGINPGRARLQTPDEGDDDEDMHESEGLPWTSPIDMTYFFLVKTTAERLTQRTAVTHAETQRLILHQMYPAPTLANVSLHDAEAEDINLQTFYSVLQPSRPYPSRLEPIFSPEGLVSQLRPYQKKTIAWLLKQEDAREVDGHFAHPGFKEPDGLWQRLRIGSQTSGFDIAFCRMLGESKLINVETEAQKRKREKGKGKDDGRNGGSDSLSTTGATPWVNPREGHLTNRGYGAMLCEEMGLGKTVEAIALMMIHRRQGPLQTSFNEETELDMTEVTATLVVTPGTLLQQWQSELEKHAPHLRVMVYTGWKQTYAWANKRNSTILAAQKRRKGDAMDLDAMEEDEAGVETVLRSFVEEVKRHDIVLTTFADVSNDYVVTKAPMKRSRRKNVVYDVHERPRCALQACEWWRIIMDEVQLVGAASNTAGTVSRIPRVFSIAMTGTPAKASVADLKMSLDFIRFPIPSKIWTQMQLSYYATSFISVFQECAVRTWKRDVKEESGMTRQQRFLVPIKLTRIELDYYRDILEKGYEALKINTAGLSEKLDFVVLRALIHDLRMCAIHIQIGQFGRPQRLGGRMRLHLGTRLLTMEEAAERMLHDAKVSAWTIEREYLASELRRALCLQQQIVEEQERHGLFKRAEERFLVVQSDIESAIKNVEVDLKFLRGSDDVITLDGSDESDETSESGEALETQEQAELKGMIGRLRAQKKEFQRLLHETRFRLGDLYSNMRSNPDEPDERETQAYESAAALRDTLLRHALAVANRTLDQVNEAVGETGINSFNDIEVAEVGKHRGIRTEASVKEANATIEALNLNLERRVWPWRSRIAVLLSQPIATTQEAVSGEEYEADLQAQAELEALLESYPSAIDYHKDMIEIDRQFLTDRKEKAEKEKKAKADREKRAKNKSDLPVILGIGEREKVEDKFQELVQSHLAVLAPETSAVEEAFSHGRSISGVLAAVAALRNEVMRDEEHQMAEGILKELRDVRKRQLEYVARFHKEAEVFRKAFNIRNLYYAALQSISDDVAIFEDPYDTNAREVQEKAHAEKAMIQKQAAAAALDEVIDVDEDDAMDIDADDAEAAVPALSPAIQAKKKAWREEALEEAVKKSQTSHVALLRANARVRFRQELSDKAGGPEGVSADDCIICRETFGEEVVDSILLDCGHQFCTGCFKALRQQNLNACMMCRQRIDMKTLTKVTYKSKDEIASSAMVADGSHSGVMKKVVIDKLRLDPELFHVAESEDEMLRMDIIGEHGSKIDHLVRHLLWWRKKDRTVKHLVFSAWADALNIVEHALHANGITYISFDNAGAAETFQTDDSIMVFLLHAEKQSAGLTLTAASVVHLLNPTLEQSFELQAIGRVDRMGQTKDTTVFCYAACDTIETKMIHRDLRRGASIYSRVDGMDPTERITGQTTAAGKRADDAGGTADDLLALLTE